MKTMEPFHKNLEDLVKEGKITEVQKHEMLKEATREYYSTFRVRK